MVNHGLSASHLSMIGWYASTNSVSPNDDQKVRVAGWRCSAGMVVWAIVVDDDSPPPPPHAAPTTASAAAMAASRMVLVFMVPPICLVRCV